MGATEDQGQHEGGGVNLAFVILQYMAANETVECVESIRAHVGAASYKIVIVDNCSPDDSYEVVERRFGGAGDVVLIRSDENLGFARGNNLGYRYAREHLNPEYVVMLNNDVLLFQDGLYEWLLDCERRHGFAVAGPMILTADGAYTSSPMLPDRAGIRADQPATREEFEHDVKNFERKLLLIKLHVYRPIRWAYRKFLKKPEVGGTGYLSEQVNLRLHGSFLVFSRAYLGAFPEGLDGRTFMYDEEYFLQYHVLRRGLTMLYSPAYCVYHKEDASTGATLGSDDVRKARFQLSGMVRSRRAYLQMLEEEGE